MLDFAIVGGGPVGLLCAVALRRLGRSVTLFEQRRAPRGETRSIGIHAASLAGLDSLGLLEPFVARGVRIARGVAVGSRGRLGAIDFGRVSPRFGFALAVPQPQTEAVLEHAGRCEGVRVLRGASVVALEQRRDHVAVAYSRVEEPAARRLTARYVLGCDGAHSRVRSWLGIDATRRRLPGSFAMAEFAGVAELGSDAWIFLADAGLVESFPLPEDRRRWVVELPTRRERVDAAELCALVEARTGHRLEPEGAGQGSTFGVTQALARRFRRDRVLLLGDAAHTLSPFGGQGMNLGWLDAFALAARVGDSWTGAGLGDATLDGWERERRRAARIALRQAAFNTRIGRRGALPRVRNAVVRVVLSAPLSAIMTRRFAMQELSASPSAGTRDRARRGSA